MEKKNTILLTVIAIATLLVAVVGATFAYFTATTKTENGTNTQTVIRSATLGVTYHDGDKVSTIDNNTPLLPGQSVSNTFSIENTGSVEMGVDINLVVAKNTFTTQNLKYTVQEVDSTFTTAIGTALIDNKTAPATGTSAIANQIKVAAGATKYYKLTVELVNTTDAPQNDDQGKEFDATINVAIDEAYEEYTSTTGQA